MNGEYCYLVSNDRYGETWTMGKRDTDRIEAFEMSAWTNIDRLTWIDRLIHEEVHSDGKTDRTE